jgi:hypothetical protein
MRKGCFHLLAVSLCAAQLGACSKPAGNDGSTSSTSPGTPGSAPSTAGLQPSSRADFVSRQHRFSIRYPNGAQPRLLELDKFDTAIGVIHNFSYSARVGDTAYDVMVSAYPAGTLRPESGGLLEVTRDEALAKPGASLIAERRTTVKTSRGRDIQAHFLEITMNCAHVYRLTCFFESFAYNINAGSFVGDPSMQRKMFEEFVASFRLLEEVAP